MGAGGSWSSGALVYGLDDAGVVVPELVTDDSGCDCDCEGFAECSSCVMNSSSSAHLLLNIPLDSLVGSGVSA